jgi:hypothetical protein
LKQLPRVKKWEAGQNPDDFKSFSPEEFIAAVKAGDIRPDCYKPKPVLLTSEQRAAEEEKVKKMLGYGTEIRERIKSI